MKRKSIIPLIPIPALWYSLLTAYMLTYVAKERTGTGAFPQNANSDITFRCLRVENASSLERTESLSISITHQSEFELLDVAEIRQSQQTGEGAACFPNRRDLFNEPCSPVIYSSICQITERFLNESRSRDPAAPRRWWRPSWRTRSLARLQDSRPEVGGVGSPSRNERNERWKKGKEGKTTRCFFHIILNILEMNEGQKN